VGDAVGISEGWARQKSNALKGKIEVSCIYNKFPDLANDIPNAPSLACADGIAKKKGHNQVKMEAIDGNPERGKKYKAKCEYTDDGGHAKDKCRRSPRLPENKAGGKKIDIVAAARGFSPSRRARNRRIGNPSDDEKVQIDTVDDGEHDEGVDSDQGHQAKCRKVASSGTRKTRRDLNHEPFDSASPQSLLACGQAEGWPIPASVSFQVRSHIKFPSPYTTSRTPTREGAVEQLQSNRFLHAPMSQSGFLEPPQRNYRQNSNLQHNDVGSPIIPILQWSFAQRTPGFLDIHNGNAARQAFDAITAAASMGGARAAASETAINSVTAMASAPLNNAGTPNSYDSTQPVHLHHHQQDQLLLQHLAISLLLKALQDTTTVGGESAPPHQEHQQQPQQQQQSSLTPQLRSTSLNENQDESGARGSGLTEKASRKKTDGAVDGVGRRMTMTWRRDEIVCLVTKNYGWRGKRST
jgi:hypothetical protein